MDRTFFFCRKDKLTDNDPPANDVTDADNDVEMTDESQPNSLHGSTSQLQQEEADIDATAVAKAAYAISQSAVDAALAGGKSAEATVLVETAQALSEASLDTVGLTEEGCPHSTILATAASVAQVESALLQEAADTIEQHELEERTGPSFIKSHSLQPNPPADAHLVGSSAMNLVGNPTPRPAVSTQSLGSNTSGKIDKGVAASLTQLLSVQGHRTGRGPTSGGYITMDDLKNCVFHQGMHLRYRRRALGALPRLPKPKLEKK